MVPIDRLNLFFPHLLIGESSECLEIFPNLYTKPTDLTKSNLPLQAYLISKPIHFVNSA